MLRTELLYREIFEKDLSLSPWKVDVVALLLAAVAYRVPCRHRTNRIFAKAANETEKHAGIIVMTKIP